MKQFRIFRNHYLCDACPNEWSDEMMVVGTTIARAAMLQQNRTTPRACWTT